jgi:hypothetical protein
MKFGKKFKKEDFELISKSFLDLAREAYNQRAFDLARSALKLSKSFRKLVENWKKVKDIDIKKGSEK